MEKSLARRSPKMNTHKPLIEGGCGGRDELPPTSKAKARKKRKKERKQQTRLDRPRMIKKSELGSRREQGLLGLPFKLSK